ncbi:uncharacterized protein [Salmo salar]|uniref:Immunoglobulin domain-containing protein n=1 Tax=Salmo salar TaxID=8030 RepID=A0A1S3S2L0_SALSA|nr:uncharacterized protein LOC106606633 [Salmo salar]|eukprot:XP_014058449.1 PREDICTED: uncharacterized protein LOC106606633 [Salmo salar]
MSALCLCCAIFLCLLCCTLAEKGSKGLLVRKQEGDTMTIHCSTSLPDQENLSVYMRRTKEIEVLYFYQAREKLTLHETFKLRLMTNGRLNKMDITITNLTIEDSGVYWCVYSVYKSPKNEKTEGEGAVLLVVNDEECDQNDASSGLGMSWYLVLVSAVTAGFVLLLSLLILFIWVIPRCLHSHSREVTVVRFDGQLINETDTPAQLEMED